jgi:hypothetical protein
MLVAQHRPRKTDGRFFYSAGAPEKTLSAEEDSNVQAEKYCRFAKVASSCRVDSR